MGQIEGVLVGGHITGRIAVQLEQSQRPASTGLRHTIQVVGSFDIAGCQATSHSRSDFTRLGCRKEKGLDTRESMRGGRCRFHPGGRFPVRVRNEFHQVRQANDAADLTGHGGCDERIGVRGTKKSTAVRAVAHQMQAEGRFHSGSRSGDIQKQTVGMRSGNGKTSGPGKCRDSLIRLLRRTKPACELPGRQIVTVKRIFRVIHTAQKRIEADRVAQRKG